MSIKLSPGLVPGAKVTVDAGGVDPEADQVFESRSEFAQSIFDPIECATRLRLERIRIGAVLPDPDATAKDASP